MVKRYLLFAIIVALLAASTTSCILFQASKRFYAELNRVRLDPLGLLDRRFTTPKSDPFLAFYGDSRAEQWPSPSWVKGIIANLGVGGQTTEQILGRFDASFGSSTPSNVVFQAGINDLKVIPLFGGAIFIL